MGLGNSSLAVTPWECESVFQDGATSKFLPRMDERRLGLQRITLHHERPHGKASFMTLQTARARPCSWASLSNRVTRRWLIPFIAFEWIWDWAAFLLSRWSFLEVLDYLGRFSILVAVVFYFSESGNG